MRTPAVLALGAALLAGFLPTSVVSANWSDPVPTRADVCSKSWDWRTYTDITSAGDWDGDGKNDVIALRADKQLLLHPGTGTGTFTCPVPMGAAPAGTVSITYMEAGTSSAAGLFAISTTTSVNGRANPSYFATPVVVPATGKRQGVSTWQEDLNSGWNVFDTVIGVPGLEAGKSSLVAKWPRSTLSNLFAYTLNNANMVVNVVGNPTAHDAEPGMTGWNEWFPGDSLVAVGDWNGDGFGDMGGVAGGSSPHPAGTMIVYRGNGTGARGLGSNGSQAIGTGWNGFTKLQGGYDYSGDARPDILGINPANGQLLMWRWIQVGSPAGGVSTL